MAPRPRYKTPIMTATVVQFGPARERAAGRAAGAPPAPAPAPAPPEARGIADVAKILEFSQVGDLAVDAAGTVPQVSDVEFWELLPFAAAVQRWD
jgi:hypothetical protein